MTGSNLTPFQQLAVVTAVGKMLGGKNFSICDLDAIAKTIGCESALAGADYAALRSIHCVDWADMGPDLARLTREKCLEMLGLPPEIIDAVQPESGARSPVPPPSRMRDTVDDPVVTRPRLAFWRGRA